MTVLTRKDLAWMTGSKAANVAEPNEIAAQAAAGRDGFVARLLSGLRRARLRRRTLDELSRLDAAQLRDIGLEPGTLTESVAAMVECRRPAFHEESRQRAAAPLAGLRRSLQGQQPLERLNDHLLADIGMTREELANRVLDQRLAAANRNRGFFRAA